MAACPVVPGLRAAGTLVATLALLAAPADAAEPGLSIAPVRTFLPAKGKSHDVGFRVENEGGRTTLHVRAVELDTDTGSIVGGGRAAHWVTRVSPRVKVLKRNQKVRVKVHVQLPPKGVKNTHRIGIVFSNSPAGAGVGVKVRVIASVWVTPR